MEHGLLPEAAAALDCRDGEDDDQSQDTFNRARDYAKCESVRVIFVPCLDIESEKACPQKC